MPREHAFTCSLPMGIHDRPAGALEEVARRFVSVVTIVNQRTGETANAKSVLAIVGLDIRLGDPCLVSIDGADEASALGALAHFVDRDLPHCDDALKPAPTAPEGIRLPPVLRAAGPLVRIGTPVSPGIARGRAVRIGGATVPPSIPRRGVGDAAAELERLSATLDAVVERYDRQLVDLGDSVEADVLRAHRSVTRDPEFRRRLEAAVRERGCTVAGAIEAADAYFSAMLFSTGSVLLRERALDVRDVCLQLLRQAYGDAVEVEDICLPVDAVCVADALTPGRFLALDRRHIKGLVLAHAGTTSHTVILARSFGIPALVGIDGGDLDGQDVIVDADLGVLVTTLTDTVRRYYDLETRRLAARQERLRVFAERRAATEDGRRIVMAANVASAEETAAAIAAGAEGIGVFRTEMLFLRRDVAPAEDEQFAQYRRALIDAGGRPVIIRTLDVGGDKPIPYLRLSREDNPFLGYRAVRLYPEFEAIFRNQVRALVRASAFGSLKIVIPMVSALEEVTWVRAIIADEQEHLARDGVAFDASMAVGAMIEVPSAAFMLDRLCGQLDFFSIGTNDLLQYFRAVDRASPKVSGLYDPLNPAFLRLLHMIVTEIHARGRWVGLCGEMVGEIRSLPLLVGLGLDELSMAAPSIPQLKAELAGLAVAPCRALLEEALDCPTAGDVGRLLEQFTGRRPAPLIHPDLVVTASDSTTKEEAVKELVDRLFVVGRTDRPREVEESIWQREAVCSTGFGHGFATPYCKTDAVRADSLAVLKLTTPVEWGSLDGKPVSMLLLLVIRESAQASAHMEVLAALVRHLMHEEVRDRLIEAQDAGSLCAILAGSVVD